jgi:DNA (cytosine-5)-methyltransferase 1
MKTISLFSGCGGMDLGAEDAGAEIILHNENNPDACESLDGKFKRAEIICEDIQKIDLFPKAELVIGGYPCQSFSMGGNRNPEKDSRTYLYLEFARCVDKVNPKFFVAENVSGLQKLGFLEEQIRIFNQCGKYGYEVTPQVLNARDYGVPQARKRLFIVGVRKDLGKKYVFPEVTHGKATKKNPALKPFASHGDAIKGLPIWPSGEFYERPHDEKGHMSWYYMSRNRKAKWDEPSYTVVANWRHITLHPSSPVMKLTWSNLEDGWKQRWDFSDEYEHTANHPERPILEIPRRLSWRECALIQTFPKDFEPAGSVQSKFTQIGNAVPPMLAHIVLAPLLSGEGLEAVGEVQDSLGRSV